MKKTVANIVSAIIVCLLVIILLFGCGSKGSLEINQSNGGFTPNVPNGDIQDNNTESSSSNFNQSRPDDSNTSMTNDPPINIKPYVPEDSTKSKDDDANEPDIKVDADDNKLPSSETTTNEFADMAFSAGIWNDSATSDKVKGFTFAYLRSLIESYGYQTFICCAYYGKEFDKCVIGIGYTDYTEFDTVDAVTYVEAGFLLPTNDNSLNELDFANGAIAYDIENENAEELVFAINYYLGLEKEHFIFDNTYIQIHNYSNYCVQYSTYENNKKNYDLSIGSIYNYDTNEYRYISNVGDEYHTFDGVSLIEKIDYEAIKKECEDIIKTQEANGYSVENFTVLYIAPEYIEEALATETLINGIPLSEILSVENEDTYVEITGTGQYTTHEQFNWKKLVAKIGIGIGIIIIGAAIAPLTGGSSFWCAAAMITKTAITTGLISAGVTLFSRTISGVIKGQSFIDSLKSAAIQSVYAFADGFVTGAVMGAITVGSGLVQACFTGDTQILVPSMVGGMTSVAIKDITNDDYVYSYDFDSGKLIPAKVLETYVHETNLLLEITIDNEILTTTPTHPFWCVNKNGWVEAGTLRCGDTLLSNEQKEIIVDKVAIRLVEKPILVYNLNVEGCHNYYVASNNELKVFCVVHNECWNTTRKNYWKQQSKNPLNTGKYKLTPENIKRMELGKAPIGNDGYSVNLHHVFGKKVDQYNFIELTRTEHILFHKTYGYSKFINIFNI